MSDDDDLALEELEERCRKMREGDIARREEAGQRLGDLVVSRIDTTMKATRAALDRPLRGEEKRHARPPRPATWAGPHRGRRFKDPEALKKAVWEECQAGHAQTWGKPLSDREIATFSGVIRTLSDGVGAIEKDGREKYSALKHAIDEAIALARRCYNQTYGVATVAAEALWGLLPVLPALEDLPHYERPRPARAVLVEFYNDSAMRLLKRPLSGRELAEKSILLGVAEIPYTRMLKKNATGIKAADVIDYEARRVVKHKPR